MQEPSVIIKRKQECKTRNECVRLLYLKEGYISKSKGDICLAKCKNLEYISLLQSRATLAKNLQNQQNVAVSLVPRHSIQRSNSICISALA